jgi:adenylate cyclase
MGFTIQDLFDEKERQGLRLMLMAKLGILGLMMAVFLIIEANPPMLMLAGGFLVLYVPLTLFFLKHLTHGKDFRLAGLFSLISDAVLLGVIPVVWAFELKEIYPDWLLLKFEYPIVPTIFLAVNSLTLHPKYPIVITSTTLIVMGGMLAFALLQPGIELTNDWGLTYTTAAVTMEGFLSQMLSILTTGALLTAITILARNSLHRAVELEKINGNLERYFSPSVIDAIEQSEALPFSQKVSNEKIAVMFSDLRGFTAFSDTHDPEEVVSFLREYHNRMVKVIFDHGGTVDKFLGDGIMVTFGTPIIEGNEAQRAVKAAMAMKKEMDAINATRAAVGKTTLQQGIGIHYGPAIIGNIGSNERMEYTAIGDTVNTASRIEGQCAALGEELLISQSVKEQIAEGLLLKSYPDQTLKGKGEKMALYSLRAS